jgi:hypothetical protein
MGLVIKSGKCVMGSVGDPTTIKDARGLSLFVGDIVATYTVDHLGQSCLHGLTAVVDGGLVTYTNGKTVNKIPDEPPFVMGTKSIDFCTDDEWFCLRLKSHKDVIPGEHWPEYGFSYEEVHDER